MGRRLSHLLLDVLRLDARRAARRLVHAPGFSATVVLSLAVGMASVIALLGLVDTLFFREPAGVRDPERVVAVGPWSGFLRTTYPDYVDLRDQARTFESVGAFGVWNYSARVGDAVSPARGLLASHSLLPTLGITPAVGRIFSAEDDRPDAPRVVLLGRGLRARHFASDAAALGQMVRLAGLDFTVIGVLPSTFTAPDMSPVDLVVPIENAPWFGGREALVNRDYQWVRIVGRLRPGVSAAAASAEASAIYRRANVGVRSVDQETLSREIVTVQPLHLARRDPTSTSARMSVWLMRLAAAVLLIACANAASLLVARGISEQRELAVHVALGAGRERLALRALLEVGALVTLAGLLALVIANVGGGALGALLLGNTVAPPPIDARTGLTAAAVAALTCVVCVLGPVARVTRTNPGEALASHSRTATSSRRGPMRALVAVQIALGVVLVSEASVFAVSFRKATRVDLGFDVSHLAVADVDLRAAGLSEASSLEAATRGVERVRRIPGVAAAGMTNAASMPGFINYPTSVPGRDSAPPGVDDGEPFTSSVTPGFLEALAVPLRRGRMITAEDVAAQRAVIVVSERLARLYWPGASAIGQCIRIGRRPTTPCAEVVGVVGDRRQGPGAAHGVAELYLPLASRAVPAELARTFLGREIAIRLDAARPELVGEIQRTLLETIRGLTSVRVRSGEQYLEMQTRSWRLGAVVIGAFAGVAMLLAAVGVFGVWSHAVAARRTELGIRGALGALPSQLAFLVVREALLVAAVGLGVGIAGAVAASGTVRALTFGVSPLDPRILVGSALAFVAVTCVATLVPAIRAAATDPRTTLAAE